MDDTNLLDLMAAPILTVLVSFVAGGLTVAWVTTWRRRLALPPVVKKRVATAPLPPTPTVPAAPVQTSQADDPFDDLFVLRDRRLQDQRRRRKP